MRWVLFLFILAGICSGAKSQGLFVSARQHSFQSPAYKPTLAYSTFDNAVLPPGYRMRRVGSTLTIAGAAMFLGGIVVISNADKTAYYNSSTGQQVYDDPMVGVGALMVVGGVGMMVPGIIFWVKGAKRYNRYLDNLQGTIKTNGTGLAITLKF